MTTIEKYQNGDYTCELFADGTLVRTWDVENPVSQHPNSLDVKITNYCNANCRYCHENSTTNGQHGDLQHLRRTLLVLPRGVEVAIGGGNPLSHPELEEFLQELSNSGIVANLTVNQVHVKPHFDQIRNLIEKDLIKGLGISVNGRNFAEIKELRKITNNMVFHVIAGVNPVEVIDELIALGGPTKVLVLGYKQFGRGTTFFSSSVEKNLRRWEMFLYPYFGKCSISFDNLAIEQLRIKRFLSEEKWNEFFMGEDGEHTMYIDAVEQKFAKTSRTAERKSFAETNLIDFFQSL